MIEKRVFENVAEYERFNKMYNDYIQQGVEATKALDLTREAFCPSKKLSEAGRKAYDNYIFKYGLNPEDAYILASRKEEVKSAEKVEEKKEEKKEERSPAVKSFFDDWFAPVKDWTDMLQPIDRLFNDSFMKDFGMPCWIDWWNDRKPKLQNTKKAEEKCQCECERKEEKSPVKTTKAVDIVNDEIKKVLNSLPKEEVNSKTTKVNILKNDPNDYEFNVDHTSADGKSHFHCTKKFYKNI